MMTTATETTISDDTGMSYLTSITVGTFMDQTVGEDTTTQPRSQSNHHKITHTSRTAESMFTKRYHLGIIGYCHRHSQTVAHHRANGNNTFPRHIGRVLHTACSKIGTGTTHAHRTNGLITTVRLNHHKDPFTQRCNIIIGIRIVLCRKTILHKDLAFCVDNGISSLLQTNIYTNNPLLYYSLFHVLLLVTCRKYIHIFDTMQIFAHFFCKYLP